MRQEKTIWISYDLGIRGDYAGFYTWLDKFGAKECGDSLAVIKTSTEGDLTNELKEDLLKYVQLSKNDRVYLIYKDNVTGSIKGVFLFGGRKRAPWEGYSQTSNNGLEDY